ncbi:MAG TPA: helix-turn-helix domain-containing protein [Blastocatellia bacterium]|nr:helix-turn-helix domain-containing protein [Blastocatellia bacterium]
MVSLRFWFHIPRVFFQHHKPGPPLSEFVEKFWFYDGYVLPHSKERLLPSGEIDLVINLREDAIRIYDRDDTSRLQRLRGAVLAGPHSEFFVIDTHEQESVIGIQFKPGGARPFFGLPASELHNQHVPLEDLWKAKAGDLRCRLLEARTPEAKFRVLEQALLAERQAPLEPNPAVRFALRELISGPHIRTISDVTAEIGLSPRRFIQLFSDEVGLTPKLFCRIRRFQRVLARIGNERPVDWADVALSCGYFDQSHFIHDFRAFSGLSPTTYNANRGQHPNHVPLTDT